MVLKTDFDDRDASMSSHKSLFLRRGFTIVELLIVIVVIGVLAAIIIVSYTGITNQANMSSAMANAKTVAQKAEAYRVQNNDLYPTKAALGSTDSSLTYIQYGSGTGYCASSINGQYSYYVSNFQVTPAPGECEGSTMSNNADVGSACPAGYLPIPGDSRFGTKDFCVMKYEAKNVSSVATSQASGTPWVSISQTSAISTSSAACTGCHLMTEAEWMTVAANVLSVAANWSGGAVGSGYIYSGHNDNSPANALAASTDDDGYNGTGNVAPSNQKRTLYLTTGATIWDFAGNVWEWTSQTITPSNIGVSGDSAFTWRQWNLGASLSFGNLPVSSLPSAISSTVAGWSSTQGIGQLYANYADTSQKAFIRGGFWTYGASTGVLTLYLSDAPSSTAASIGFRVSR